MSAENLNHRLSAENPGTSSKHKRSILYDKTFMIDIVDKSVYSKVEKLIGLYGGMIMQTLEKNIDYLISDMMNSEKSKHKNSSETSNCRRDIEVQNIPSSKYTNSINLINKANLLNIQILSAKQFQRWLKSLLKKRRVSKKPTDKVASVLRGKVSLKIESMDQAQCPVFEFIPKWPDLGDTLSKKNSKTPVQPHLNGDVSGDEYSSDQYSTSEIGGMCELCDMPFMNYKEHINTKKHLRESQDDNRFHELDELINERPLNVIFNHFVPEKKMVEEENVDEKTSNIKNCMDNTIIEILDSDSDNTEQKNVPYSFGNQNPSISKKQNEFICLKRKYSDTNITFVPQKRPSKLKVPFHKEINHYRKTKRKHKTYQKSSSKDIYKVEVVNNQSSGKTNYSNNDRNVCDKPPVIIRLKRIKHSRKKKLSSDVESHISVSSNNDEGDREIPEDPIPIQRYIRVVRKPSFSNEIERASSKSYSENQTFTFEHPELRQKRPDDYKYYPTFTLASNLKPSIKHIQEKTAKLKNSSLKCTLSLKQTLKILSNTNYQKIGEWFYNTPKKILDQPSFNSNILIPCTKCSKI